MKLSSISRKFLFSHKSHSLVNLVAIVSVVAIAVPSAAMIIVLSLQNGLSGLVKDLYADFDSEIRVTPKSGQYFEVSEDEMYELQEFAHVAPTLESSAVAQYNDTRILVTLRGVDSSYQNVSNLPSIIKRGEWKLKHGDRPRAIMGAGASYNLALSIGSGRPLELSTIVPVPKIGMIGGGAAISTAQIHVAGVFSIEAQIDSQYLFADIDFVRELLGKDSEISSLEIKPNIPYDQAKQRILEILEEDVIVKNRFEQRSTIFSAIEAERIVIFSVLLFVALVAAMSLAGCSLMMTTEKASSAAVLRSLGMSEKKVRKIFISLGMRVVSIGVGIGLLFGVALVLVQQYLKPLASKADGMVVDEYPVKLFASDFIFTATSMLIVGYLIIYFTIRTIRFSTQINK